MSVFINISNHPSNKWSAEQLAAAQEFGDIIDIDFPQIVPGETIEEIQNKANSIFSRIKNFRNPVVMVQGEFTLTYQLVTLLQKAKIRTVASTQNRTSKESVDQNGNTIKVSSFCFEGFRDYYI